MTAATTDPVRAHYERLLAPIYRWMLGDFAVALERSRAELGAFGIGPASVGARALDLGAGLGLQSIPLADAGYQVTAIDSSAELLAELRAERASVTTISGDLLELNALAPGSFDVVVCMGDTLTHLPSQASVERLLIDVCLKLEPGGTLALTFRDYASHTLTNDARFSLVRADPERVLTCFLEYGEARVQVTDIVHERAENGWTMRASVYPKLRLSAAWVRSRIEAAGVGVVHEESAHGRITIVARRRGA